MKAECENWDFQHMAYMAEIKIKLIKILEYIQEGDIVCSRDEAISELKNAIYLIHSEETSERK